MPDARPIQMSNTVDILLTFTSLAPRCPRNSIPVQTWIPTLIGAVRGHHKGWVIGQAIKCPRDIGLWLTTAVMRGRLYFESRMIDIAWLLKRRGVIWNVIPRNISKFVRHMGMAKNSDLRAARYVGLMLICLLLLCTSYRKELEGI